MQEDETSSLSVSSVGASKRLGRKNGRCCLSANPRLKRGRRLQLLQMLALPFVPILALIVQNAFTLRSIMVNRHEVTEIDRQVSFQFTTHMTMDRLQIVLLVFRIFYLHHCILATLVKIWNFCQEFSKNRSENVSNLKRVAENLRNLKLYPTI
jgi:hypothetical protein